LILIVIASHISHRYIPLSLLASLKLKLDFNIQLYSLSDNDSK